MIIRSHVLQVVFLVLCVLLFLFIDKCLSRDINMIDQTIISRLGRDSLCTLCNKPFKKNEFVFFYISIDEATQDRLFIPCHVRDMYLEDTSAIQKSESGGQHNDTQQQ